MTLRSAILVSMFAVLLTPAFPQAEATPANIDGFKRVFEIPAYPGTVPFRETPRFERWHAPFGTSLRVFKTKDGGPLDTQKIIGFYQDHLSGKGWKEDIFKREGDEGYLGMSISLFDVSDGMRTQLSGKFYLWIAPRDGIYTILIDQWRISSVNQTTRNFLSKVYGSLENIGDKHGYRVQKVHSDGEWITDYENEYLIERERFTFITKDATGRHPGIGQSIDLFILTYRDSAIAEAEAQRRRPSTTPQVAKGDGRTVILPLPSRGVSHAFVMNRTVFFIRDHSGKQKEAVDQITAALERLLEF